MTDINLLAKQDADALKKSSFALKLKNVSILSLCLTAFLSVAVFFLKVTSPLSNLKTQEVSLVTQISQFSQVIVEKNLLADKMKIVSEVTAKRPDLSKSLSLFNSSVFSNMVLSSVSINKDGFSFTASSPDLLSMNSMLDTFTQMAKDKKIKNVILESLYVIDGKYVASLIVSY